MFVSKSCVGTAFSALLVASLSSIVSGADCDRAKLIAAADTYIAAQQSGKLDDLQKLLSADAKYRQNNKASDFKTGLLSKTLKIDHNRTIADTTNCATFTELISTGGPYVIGTQLRHDGDKITLVDTIAATTGDWAFDAKKTLQFVTPEDWGTLDEAKRSPRDTLKAAGDAYLDMWTEGTAAKNRVPWGNPCARTEGSAHVTPDCRSGAPSAASSMKIGDRRYVIDETVGSCNVLCAFGSLPDSHEFRLVSGKVSFVHTITV